MEIINFLIEHYYLSIPLLTVLVLLILSNAKKGGKKISCQTLISMTNQNRALIIDIRDSESFNAGHITASKNIPQNELTRRINEITNIDKSVILVCDMGNISPNAGEALKKEGFEDIYLLKGGINQWRMDNLPLV
ncbi:MAG: rhodanese-like domain-containing protein [SAR86 cluster bacterium]|jgi:rhodanese-related sulfurtransferase|uniref:Rhodanese-like domain-containing protein n=1 Tax=SAR86 cluster bacterium TaxID=2030880 RepID=A0A520N6X5_9GAMM|nr:MAG: rhodanese-like domain-containing protein [SAR86 cluster bacterium]|tara:strand:+ start:1219 stop:1623 length:405 start_codon:yes stop_codon:yes gene_type:complete